MKNKKREWLTITFITVAGAIIGLFAYLIISHVTDNDFAGASLVSTMVYSAIAGLLLSGLVTKERNKHDT